MIIINAFIQVGILWFLITLFTGATNSSQTLTHTWIIVIGMVLVSIITAVLLTILGLPELIGLPVKVGALYLLVDKVCQCSQQVTLKICGWYLGISFLLGILFALMKM